MNAHTLCKDLLRFRTLVLYSLKPLYVKFQDSS